MNEQRFDQLRAAWVFGAQLLIVALVAAGVLAVSPQVAHAQGADECFVPIVVPDESIDSRTLVLSGDGSRLAYTTADGRDPNKLVSMSLDGSDVQVLADVSAGLFFTDVTLSRNGAAVTARAVPGGSYELGNTMVFSRDVDGYGDPKVFAGWYNPKLSANGTTVAFQNSLLLSSTTEIMTWDLVADVEVSRIAVPEAEYGFIELLADGNTVVYSRLDGPSPIRVIVHDLASGTGQTVLSGVDGVHDISADGRRIVYSVGGLDVNYNYVGEERVFYVDLDYLAGGIEVSPRVELTALAPLFADPFFFDWNEFYWFELSADGTSAAFVHFQYYRFDATNREELFGVIDLDENRADIDWSGTAGVGNQQPSLSDDGSFGVMDSFQDGLGLFSLEGDCAISSDLLDVGVNPSGFVFYRPAGDFNSINRYGANGDLYCVANVTGEEYPVVCWDSNDGRQEFVDDVVALSPPSDQILWLGEAIEIDEVPTPVKP